MTPEIWQLQEDRKTGLAIATIEKNAWLLNNKSFCFMDLETSNLNASIGEILCGSVKPRGKRPVTFMSDILGDGNVVLDISGYLKQFDYVCTYYGTGFDMPFLATRLKIHGYRSIGPMRHIDMYYTARNKLKLHSNRLQVVAETLFGRSSKTRILGNTWNDAMKGDEKAMKYVAKHCEEDVKELERVFNELVEYRNLGATPIRYY